MPSPCVSPRTLLGKCLSISQMRKMRHEGNEQEPSSHSSLEADQPLNPPEMLSSIYCITSPRGKRQNFPFQDPRCCLCHPSSIHPRPTGPGGPAPPGFSPFYCTNLQCNVLPATWLHGAYINYPTSAINCLSRLIVSINLAQSQF